MQPDPHVRGVAEPQYELCRDTRTVPVALENAATDTVIEHISNSITMEA